ncbi:hypothetical protein [Shimia sp.]
MTLMPFLKFDGTAEEAIGFCAEVFGATFYAPSFGMLTDPFGTHGMIGVL